MSDERLDDERLRDVYARAVDARRAPGRAGCADPDALLALVRREGPEPARLRTLDHAMACADCRRELELLRAIDRAGNADVGRAVEGLRWRRTAAVALAASALLAVSLVPARRLMDGRDERVMRGDDAGVALLVPTASATATTATPLTFTWHAVPGARRYTVELLDAEGIVALGGETSDTTLALTPPGSLRAGEYRWWVRAQTDDGASVRSAARPLRLLRP